MTQPTTPKPPQRQRVIVTQLEIGPLGVLILIAIVAKVLGL